MAEDPAAPASDVVELPPEGYDLGDELGRGGMGEVLAAHDLRIGRDLAIKRLHGSRSPRAVARFLREARVQAQLQHPSILPVHRLGIDDEGRPFFAMKRLSGDTLEQRIADRAPLQALLRAFAEVIGAIAFAHARGVVHRDLKPTNVMLGQFGEVYVIDWGLAREIDAPADDRDDDDDDDDDAAALPRPAPRVSSPEIATRVGAVLGTPGYMAPEQVRGETSGPPADVYALGAILFEILTGGEPLHPRGDDAMVSTLTSAPSSPAARAPDRPIALELDELCLAMQAENPEDRPTARAVAETLRHYLDGDRDLERRRTLAAEQLALARTAFDGGGAPAHMTALRHAARALALDPESADAADFVGQLALARPTEMPPALVDSLGELDRDAIRKRSRRAVRSYGAVFALLAVVPFLDVESWPWLGACFGMLAVLIGVAWRGTTTGTVSPHLSMLGNCLLTVAWSRVAGPFVLTPVMICGASIAVASHPWNQERPWTIFAWGAITVVAPFVLEALGVFGSTWSIHGGSLEITSAVFALRGHVEAGVLFAVDLGFVLLVGGFAYTITRNGRQASRDHHIQAWHLGHLIPEHA